MNSPWPTSSRPSRSVPTATGRAPWPHGIRRRPDGRAAPPRPAGPVPNAGAAAPRAGWSAPCASCGSCCAARAGEEHHPGPPEQGHGQQPGRHLGQQHDPRYEQQTARQRYAQRTAHRPDQRSAFERYRRLGAFEKQLVEVAALQMITQNPQYAAAYGRGELPVTGAIAGEAQARHLQAVEEAARRAAPAQGAQSGLGRETDPTLFPDAAPPNRSVTPRLLRLLAPRPSRAGRPGAPKRRRSASGDPPWPDGPARRHRSTAWRANRTRAAPRRRARTRSGPSDPARRVSTRTPSRPPHGSPARQDRRPTAPLHAAGPPEAALGGGGLAEADPVQRDEVTARRLRNRAAP